MLLPNRFPDIIFLFSQCPPLMHPIHFPICCLLLAVYVQSLCIVTNSLNFCFNFYKSVNYIQNYILFLLICQANTSINVKLILPVITFYRPPKQKCHGLFAPASYGMQKSAAYVMPYVFSKFHPFIVDDSYAQSLLPSRSQEEAEESGPAVTKYRPQSQIPGIKQQIQSL